MAIVPLRYQDLQWSDAEIAVRAKAPKEKLKQLRVLSQAAALSQKLGVRFAGICRGWV